MKTQRKAPAKAQKADKSRIPCKPNAKDRIQNWTMYDESLKKRGIIALWKDENLLRVGRAAAENVKEL